MTYALTQSVVPASEPISIADAKSHLRVDFADDDRYIDGLIVAARMHAEEVLNRQLIGATWEMRIDEFPSSSTTPILIPRPPLTAVSSIAYIDGDGVTQTWGASNYRADIKSEPGRITPAYGLTWPSTQDVTNAVTITYTAGYASASAVPMPIRQAMLLLIGHWYRNREAVNIGHIVNEIPMAVESLLWPYRVFQ